MGAPLYMGAVQLTLSTHRETCMPRRRRVRNTRSQHDCPILSAYIHSRSQRSIAYGAIIARALGCGTFPTSWILSGTWSSQVSSSLERVAPCAEYHEPAWVHLLFAIALVEGLRFRDDLLHAVFTLTWRGFNVGLAGYPTYSAR